MKLPSHLAAMAAACAALALPAVAAAQAPAPAGSFVIGFQVVAIDAGAGTATGVMHCVDPSRAGRQATFPVAPGVDVAALAPGAIVGVRIDGGRIAETRPQPPCDLHLGAGQPQGPGFPDGAGLPDGAAPDARGEGPGHGGPAQRPGDGPGQGQLMPGFTNRVWKFAGSADGFEDGKLSITLEKILNLPKRFASQDDDLIDEDAIVLVGKGTKVLDKSGHRVAASELADADEVRVQGKLLPPKKWQTDQDDQPVTTIRAKRVTIVG